ncbi:MAG: ATP-binding protein [Gammaproteobacteria bacterium]
MSKPDTGTEDWPPRLTPIQRLVARIQARPDTEFQQALLRLIIVVGFYVYFWRGTLDHSVAIASQVHFLGIGLTLVSLSLLLGALIDLKPSPLRRGVGMLHDFTVATYMLAISNETGAPLVALYLWVTLGNGFRYGLPYLYVSTAASALGFAIVYLSNPFWQAHVPLWWGIWLTLIVVPLYASSLLRQLHGAIKREQEASLAKSSFLANMSHELRTPLNGVIGVADLLAETRLDKQQQEYAQIIHASAHTLLELIDNVLDISRIEAGKITCQSEDFDLHQLIHRLVSMLETQARAKGLILAAHIAPQTPFHLYGDARHLRQILIDLIGNAIKFTEYGRVDIYIHPVGQSHTPQRLRFEVVDTGIGIPEASQARIFESFSQADTSVTRRFGGSGLGTTIAKQLVEMLGGDIGLHSRVSEGTTLWFELPFIPQAAHLAIGAHRFDAPMRVALLAGGNVSERVQTMIRAWGGETVLVENTTRLAAELARDASGPGTLAAVVVERSTLPGDPVAFLHLLRDDPQLANFPIILIESDAGASSARDVLWVREGFASVLRAPVNPTLLFNAIHAVLSQEMPHNVVSLAHHYQSLAGNTAPLCILVAEDNPVNQRVICGLLEHAGHEVCLAHDGDEALAMLESGEYVYHLAIIDMHMPRLSGPEVVQRWRFMEKGHLPIVMLTADARAEAQAACAEAGADTFLTKPVDSRELINVIVQLANPADAPAPVPQPGVRHPDGLDEAVLDNLTQIGGAAFVQDLLASFEEDSARAMRDIEHALAAENYGRWYDQLHMLKGGASDVGATGLAQLCADAERIKPYELSGTATREKLEQVRVALNETRSALTRYLDHKLRAESM